MTRDSDAWTILFSRLHMVFTSWNLHSPVLATVQSFKASEDVDTGRIIEKHFPNHFPPSRKSVSRCLIAGYGDPGERTDDVGNRTAAVRTALLSPARRL